MATAGDLIPFHTMEQKLFNRLVTKMNKDGAKAKVVIALWLLLEEIGYYDLTRTIFSHPDSTVEAIFDETAVCLDSMGPNASEPRTSLHLASILNEPMSRRRFFFHHRVFLSSRVNHFVHNICNSENKTKEVGDSSKLNLSAKSYSAGESSSSTSCDQRTVFLTFSKGYPLREEEIIDFFTSKWGAVVEDLFMGRAPTRSNPRFGRIIFIDPTVIPRVLKGQPKVKFNVNGKHLWARVYVPQEEWMNRNGFGRSR